MDISEVEIHKSPGINVYGSIVTGELLGGDENIDVTGKEENVIDSTLCSCTGGCYRPKGRGACPCKAAKLKCANACSCNKSKCKNRELGLERNEREVDAAAFADGASNFAASVEQSN